MTTTKNTAKKPRAKKSPARARKSTSVDSSSSSSLARPADPITDTERTEAKRRFVPGDNRYNTTAAGLDRLIRIERMVAIRAAALADLDHAVAALVAEARQNQRWWGTDPCSGWPAIGRALGVSKQAAQKKYEQRTLPFKKTK